MSDTMGRNEYARHRGVAPNAVAKAIKDGRIASAVTWEEGRVKAINWRLADQLWVRNTDPAEAAKNGKFLGDEISPVSVSGGAAVDVPASGSTAPGSAASFSVDEPRDPAAAGPAELPGGNKAEPDPGGFYAGRARRMQVQAEEAELDLLERKGLLVSAKDVEDAIFECFRNARDRLQNVSARVSPRLAAESDATRIDELLNTEIAMVLDELSHDVEQLAAAGAG